MLARGRARGDLLRMMLLELPFFPELRRVAFERAAGPNLAHLGRYMAAEAERGRFRPGDPRARVIAFVGPLIALVLFKQAFGEHLPFEGEELVDGLVDTFLDGALAPDGGRRHEHNPRARHALGAAGPATAGRPAGRPARPRAPRTAAPSRPSPCCWSSRRSSRPGGSGRRRPAGPWPPPARSRPTRSRSRPRAPGGWSSCWSTRAARCAPRQPVGQIDDGMVQVQLKQAGPAERQLLEVQLERLTLRAPLTGVVLKRLARQGEVVAAGAPVLTVARLDELTLTVYVPEAELGRVAVGQAVEARADAFPGRAFPGQVQSIASRAEFTPRNVQTARDRRKLVFAVKVRLPNPGGELKPGLPVDVTFVGLIRCSAGSGRSCARSSSRSAATRARSRSWS